MRKDEAKISAAKGNGEPAMLVKDSMWKENDAGAQQWGSSPNATEAKLNKRTTATNLIFVFVLFLCGASFRFRFLSLVALFLVFLLHGQGPIGVRCGLFSSLG